MPICGKHSTDATEARRARLLDRCALCVSGLDQCPIGPELLEDAAFDFTGKSVQVSENRSRPRSMRWMVALLFSGRRIDRCYPVKYFPCLDAAKSYAFRIAVHHSGHPLQALSDGNCRAGPASDGIFILIISESAKQ
jgi:hypothetical protein